MQNLLPCPFCGSNADIKERHTDDGQPWLWQCTGCFTERTARGTKEEAIATFNIRTHQSHQAGEWNEELAQAHIERYRVEPKHLGSYRVVCGTGTREIFAGSKIACVDMAAELSTAFFDGMFVASRDATQETLDNNTIHLKEHYAGHTSLADMVKSHIDVWRSALKDTHTKLNDFSSSSEVNTYFEHEMKALADIEAACIEDTQHSDVRNDIISEIHSWAVCACIATPDDMYQNFPRIVEITSPDYKTTNKAQNQYEK